MALYAGLRLELFSEHRMVENPVFINTWGMLRYFQDISNFPVVVPPSSPPPPYKGWELKEPEDSSPRTCIDSQGGVFNSSGSSFLPAFSFVCRRILWCGVIIAKTIFGS
jgi:hypothetical protein